MGYSAKHLTEAVGAILRHESGSASIDRALRAVRRHLSMDVAFVAQFGETQRVMRHVDSETDSPVHCGLSIPLEAGYCKRVVDGQLPGVIPDTRLNAEAMGIEETVLMPIGAHISVPIWLSDGSLYGTLCCFSYQPDPTLGLRDLQFMHVFADLLSDRLETELLTNRQHEEKRARIARVFADDGLSVVYQPIYRMDDGTVSGVECLSRFRDHFHESPDKWFADAADVGLGPKLEAWAIRKALHDVDALPADVYLAINGSPELFMSPELAKVLVDVDPRRIVLEVTEHSSIADYRQLWNSLAVWRKRGMRVAIDDAGAGYASMRHILDLQPEYIKLDVSLVRNIDCDLRRRALATALISFAREIGSDVTAEGVETEAEMRTLRRLGVAKVQGFYMSRPVALAEAARLVTMARHHAQSAGEQRPR